MRSGRCLQKGKIRIVCLGLRENKLGRKKYGVKGYVCGSKRERKNQKKVWQVFCIICGIVMGLNSSVSALCIMS